MCCQMHITFLVKLLIFHLYSLCVLCKHCNIVFTYSINVINHIIVLFSSDVTTQAHVICKSRLACMIRANCPIAISLSLSMHFSLMPYSSVWKLHCSIYMQVLSTSPQSDTIISSSSTSLDRCIYVLVPTHSR